MLTYDALKKRIDYKDYSLILKLKKVIKGYKPNTKVIIGLTFHNNIFTIGVVPYYLNNDDLDYFIKYEEYNSYDEAITNLHSFITEYCKNKPLTKM